MNNMISVFENCEIQIVVENDAPLFEVYSTGMALGYITTSRGKNYPHKVRIEKVISNADITPVVQNEQRFLTESQLYDFMKKYFLLYVKMVVIYLKQLLKKILILSLYMVFVESMILSLIQLMLLLSMKDSLNYLKQNVPAIIMHLIIKIESSYLKR